MEVTLKLSGATRSSGMRWQHLVGVVQRNQLCLHSHRMTEEKGFKLFSFFTTRVIPLATVSVRVPFLFPLLPVYFSPLPPTCIQLPEEEVAHAVTHSMSRLGSFLMLCNKLLFKQHCLITVLITNATILLSLLDQVLSTK